MSIAMPASGISAEFVQAVETVTLSDRDGVLLDIDQSKRQIDNEMVRSRRTQRT